MANVALTSIPGLVTPPDANDNVLTFDGFDQLMSAPQATAFIVVTVGTFQFNSAGAIVAGSGSFTVGDTIPPIPFKPGNGLHFKASSGADRFKISVV